MAGLQNESNSIDRNASCRAWSEMPSKFVLERAGETPSGTSHRTIQWVEDGCFRVAPHKNAGWQPALQKRAVALARDGRKLGLAHLMI